MSIPIIDLFAGPGGLSEGFSAYQTSNGRCPFQIALSIEKDFYAHQTLTLRSFFRQFGLGNAPEEYYEYLQNIDEPEMSRRERLFKAHPKAAGHAMRSVLLAELGKMDTRIIREHISAALRGKGDFVLLGGPPCQAYSVMGRSRNIGNPKYRATRDKRQTLYVEYLQVLADHQPAVFIMENVKGLLSATFKSQRVFKQILDDLRSPCEAILREGRSLSDNRRRTRYNLLSIVCPDNGDKNDLDKFIIRMERYGIPQARHRLIIVGVRSDLEIRHINLLPETDPVSIEKVISDLPKVRSGLSIEKDDIDLWHKRILQFRSLPFMNRFTSHLKHPIKKEINNALISISTSKLSRGNEFVMCRHRIKYRPDWFNDPKMSGICNHTTRLHMPADLHRYLFATCYTAVENCSPELCDFPNKLLPKHKNARKSVKDGAFDDRFRVQLLDRPSTTVTSHLAKDGHSFIHPDPVQCRSMTVREVARLQTFPDNYFFCGPRTAQYIQVGNAVPPLLANQIAVSVYALLKKNGLVR